MSERRARQGLRSARQGLRSGASKRDRREGGVQGGRREWVCWGQAVEGSRVNRVRCDGPGEEIA